jgi:hypothetical protein
MGMNGFDVNSFVDGLDSYSIFDDVADSMDFASVGICTDTPTDEDEEKSESNKKKYSKNKGLVNISLRKRGRKAGQRGKCSACGSLDHNKRTCTFFPKSG